MEEEQKLRSTADWGWWVGDARGGTGTLRDEGDGAKAIAGVEKNKGWT